MKKIAHDILTEARQTRQNYQITGTNFDKIKANMYSIFECYAYGLINWDQVKTRFKKSIREYVSLYKGTKHLKEEIEIMRQEYKNTLRNYKPALDAYRVMSEQKLAAKLANKNNLSESIAKQHSSTYYNSRMLSENNLTDTVRLTWKRVMEVYPNLTNTDEARVRMLTIFEGPTINTTQLITTVMKEEPTLISGPMQTSMRPKMRPGRYDDPDQWFNPNAGHRDQPDHPENRGLTNNPSAAPTTSLRPQKRPADLAQRAAVNRAVRSAMGEHSRTEVDPGSTQQSLEGYKVLPNIDRDRYGERDGLEGPFRTLSGKVVYYDPKEGSYYDPDTDMYMTYDEFRALDNDYSGMRDERDIPVKEEMTNAEIDAFHRALDAIVHKHIGHSSHEKKKDMNESKIIATGLLRDKPFRKTFKNVEAMRVWADREDADVRGYHAAPGKGEDTQESVNTVGERSMTKGEKSKEERLKKKYDDSEMKSSMKDQYGDGWKEVYYATIRKKAMEQFNEMTSAGAIAAVAQPIGKMQRRNKVKESQMMTEAEFDESAGEKDACYNKVKSRYKVWPSAYASGALVKCRKVGAANWGNKSKK